MRVWLATAVALACAHSIGCADTGKVPNPAPTTKGSRVSTKLRAIPAPDPSNVKTVTVYRFENKTAYAYGHALSEGMTDQLITSLVKTGHFKVVERAVVDDVMTEKSLQQSGAATGQAGQTKLTGAQLIFAGAVTELDEKGCGGLRIARRGVGVGVQSTTAQVGLDMRVIDAGTGEIIDSIDARREVRKSGVSAGHHWSVRSGVEISDALGLAVHETLDEAAYQIVTRYGAG